MPTIRRVVYIFSQLIELHKHPAAKPFQCIFAWLLITVYPMFIQLYCRCFVFIGDFHMNLMVTHDFYLYALKIRVLFLIQKVP